MNPKPFTCIKVLILPVIVASVLASCFSADRFELARPSMSKVTFCRPGCPRGHHCGCSRGAARELRASFPEGCKAADPARAACRHRREGDRRQREPARPVPQRPSHHACWCTIRNDGPLAAPPDSEATCHPSENLQEMGDHIGRRQRLTDGQCDVQRRGDASDQRPMQNEA
jgi:hypothetical protein